MVKYIQEILQFHLDFKARLECLVFPEFLSELFMCYTQVYESFIQYF